MLLARCLRHLLAVQSLLETEATQRPERRTAHLVEQGRELIHDLRKEL